MPSELASARTIMLALGLTVGCAERGRLAVERVKAPPRVSAVQPKLAAAPATAPETLEPWVKPCASALADGYAKLAQGDATSRDGRIETHAAEVILHLDQDKTLAIDHAVDGSVKRWYWQSQGSPSDMDEREQGPLHARFTFARKAVVPSELKNAADVCLALGDEPPFDTEAADGVVCESAAISVLPLGRDVLVVGRDIQRIIDGETGRVSERRFDLPPDYLSYLSDELHPELTECGDGAVVLHSSDGIGFSNDGITLPKTRWWRRDGSGTWSQLASFAGRFIACGPTWTLLARAMSLEPAALFEYGHGHVWTVEAIGTYPYALAELPAGSRQCSHPFAPVSWVGFASGDVFAAGPSCGASHHLTVARWRKNSDKPELLTVSGSHKVAGFFSSIYGESVTSVNAFMPDWNFNHRRSWLAHFDGRHWSNPIVQPDQADTHLARAPQGRQGRLWKYISSAVQAPSGDLWMTGRDHQIDCGYCFMYDALLRVRKRQ